MKQSVIAIFDITIVDTLGRLEKSALPGRVALTTLDPAGPADPPVCHRGTRRQVRAFSDRLQVLSRVIDFAGLTRAVDAKLMTRLLVVMQQLYNL